MPTASYNYHHNHREQSTLYAHYFIANHSSSLTYLPRESTKSIGISARFIYVHNKIIYCCMDQGQLCTKAIYNDHDDDEFTGLEGFRVELTL